MRIHCRIVLHGKDNQMAIVHNMAHKAAATIHFERPLNPNVIRIEHATAKTNIYLRPVARIVWASQRKMGASARSCHLESIICGYHCIRSWPIIHSGNHMSSLKVVSAMRSTRTHRAATVPSSNGSVNLNYSNYAHSLAVDGTHITISCLSAVRYTTI